MAMYVHHVHTARHFILYLKSHLLYIITKHCIAYIYLNEKNCVNLHIYTYITKLIFRVLFCVLQTTILFKFYMGELKTTLTKQLKQNDSL